MVVCCTPKTWGIFLSNICFPPNTSGIFLSNIPQSQRTRDDFPAPSLDGKSTACRFCSMMTRTLRLTMGPILIPLCNPTLSFHPPAQRTLCRSVNRSRSDRSTFLWGWWCNRGWHHHSPRWRHGRWPCSSCFRSRPLALSPEPAASSWRSTPANTTHSQSWLCQFNYVPHAKSSRL